MDSDLHVRLDRCNAGDLRAVVRLLDEEFIWARQRRVSMAIRYPTVLSKANLQNIMVAYLDGAPSALAVAKQFDWVADGRKWIGAMIGMVCTRPQFRGRGLATSVLRALQETLQCAGCDFAVLWTTTPDLYTRLGWKGADIGVFGEAVGSSVVARTQTGANMVDEAAATWIDGIRSLWLPERAPRTVASYQVLPLPARTLELYTSVVGDGEQAYAIVGRTDQAGYLYEMIGHPTAFERLWSEMRPRFGKLFVNDRSSGLSQEWLSRNGQVSWLRQRLAMWLPLSTRVLDVPFEQWYIPYLDRI